jgi:hypothetical protein
MRKKHMAREKEGEGDRHPFISNPFPWQLTHSHDNVTNPFLQIGPDDLITLEIPTSALLH